MKRAQEKNALQKQKFALKVKNEEFNKEFAECTFSPRV